MSRPTATWPPSATEPPMLTRKSSPVPRSTLMIDALSARGHSSIRHPAASADRVRAGGHEDGHGAAALRLRVSGRGAARDVALWHGGTGLGAPVGHREAGGADRRGRLVAWLADHVGHGARLGAGRDDDRDG